MKNNFKINLRTMLKWFFIGYLLMYTTRVDQCVVYSHRIDGLLTNENIYGGFKFFDETLFTKKTATPKSYVVGFKYVGDAFSRVIYRGNIHSNAQDTWGSGSLSNGIDMMHDDHYLNAQIHIKNATNFSVGIDIYGASGLGYITGLSRWIKVKIFRPRSSALICAINNSQPKTKYRTLVFGRRKDGDFLLHARGDSFSSTDSQLPRHQINFFDKGMIITAAIIRINTTKAIVFHNKVKLTKHRFSATIYGLDRNTIAATSFIYGH